MAPRPLLLEEEAWGPHCQSHLWSQARATADTLREACDEFSRAGQTLLMNSTCPQWLHFVFSSFWKVLNKCRVTFSLPQYHCDRCRGLAWHSLQLLSSALTCRERTPSLRGFLAQSVRFSYRKKLRVCILVGLPLSAGRPHQLPLQGFPALGYLEPEALLHLPQQAPIVFNPRSFPGPSPSSLLPLGLHTCWPLHLEQPSSPLLPPGWLLSLRAVSLYHLQIERAWLRSSGSLSEWKRRR